MKKIILVLTIVSSLCGASTIEISPTTITDYKKTIDPFIANKKQELKNLNRLPNGNSFLGMVTNFVIESVVSPLLGYGTINIEQAKTFLGRSFADEKKLTAALRDLELHPENLTYIQTIFKELPQQVIDKKNKAAFYETVRKIKHPNVPNPKTMGDRDSNGRYLITDAHFYQMAACTFMTFHIFETTIKPKKESPKKRTPEIV